MKILDLLGLRLPGTVGVKRAMGFSVGALTDTELGTIPCDATREGEERRVEGTTGTASRKVRCEHDGSSYAWAEVGRGALDARYVNVSGDTMTGDLIVPTEAYGAGWNGSNEVPTKDAVYDKIETLQPLDADLTAIAALADPNADRLLFWDDSAGTWKHLTVGTGLAVSDVTLNATVPGLVFIDEESFSAASSVSFNSVFSNTYDSYRLVVTLTATTAVADFHLRLRASGSDASGNNYIWSGYYSASNNTSAISRAAPGSSFTLALGVGDDQTHVAASYDIARPFAADETLLHGTFANRRGDALSIAAHMGGYHDLNTSYDGFTLFMGSGTLTGSARLYGYRSS